MIRNFETHSSSLAFSTSCKKDEYVLGENIMPILYLTKEMPSARYIPGGDPKSNGHFGQLKLLLSEMKFLIDILSKITDEEEQKKIIIIYVGSAPFIHGKLLLKMFPYINWYLIDPAPFDQEIVKYSKNENTSGRVRYANEYFTDEFAKNIVSEYGDNMKIYFIGDHRREAYELSIEEDMNMQKNWIQIIKPIKSMVKFRPSWEKDEFSYIPGIIQIQQYACESSTETRYTMDQADVDREIILNAKEYEDQMFHYNNCKRMQYHKYAEKFDNIIYSKKFILQGLDHCGDCCGFLRICEMYFEASKNNKTFYQYDSIEDIVIDSISSSVFPGVNLAELYANQQLKTLDHIIDKLNNKLDMVYKSAKSINGIKRRRLYDKIDRMLGKIHK